MVRWSPVQADLGVRGVAEVTVVFKATGNIQVEALDPGDRVIRSKERDEEFDELGGGVPVEILAQRCVAGAPRDS